MPNRVVERDTGQVAGAALPVRIGLVDVAALAVERTADGRPLQVPQDAAVGVAADAQRGVGAGDQKRSREAAGGNWRVKRTRLRAEPRHIWPRWGLRELVDPFLEELLIGPQIRQLVGPSRRRTRQQYNGGDGPAD